MERKRQLYYGDCLTVLREHIPDESVDLVYLDPPFNSNATYNVLFAERNGSKAAAQIKAFEDTWSWDEGAARSYQEVVEAGGRGDRLPPGDERPLQKAAKAGHAKGQRQVPLGSGDDK